MDNSREAKLKRAHNKLVNASVSATKTCYFLKCRNKTINAHSISNKRLLLKLSDNGYVMYFDKDASLMGTLQETGRNKATVFNGFCGDHDKIFHPIDNEDYVEGAVGQEYLFAMRASAKEYTTRAALSHAMAKRIEETAPELSEFPLDVDGLELYRAFQHSFDVGLKDQSITRGIFIDTFIKSKYNVLSTTLLVVDEELPIAVSSSFNMELSYDGTVINDLSNDESALETRMKHCFLNIFPQNGKTYCLISYLKRDRKDYDFLQSMNGFDESLKKVIISNLLTSYTENFTANPTYWRSLSADTLKIYFAVYANSFKAQYAPFIANHELNLFPSAQVS